MKLKKCLLTFLIGFSLLFSSVLTSCGDTPDAIEEDGPELTNPDEEDSKKRNDEKKEDEKTPTEFTVTFDVDGGSTIAAQTVKTGEKATKPATDPTKDGFDFAGWFSDSEKKTAFDFDTAIKAATTIYAKWTVKEGFFEVTFNTNGGSAISKVSVKQGEKVTRPADPTKQYNEFLGWYTDANFTTAFDFNTAITAAVTLYAKWKENPNLDVSNGLVTNTASAYTYPSESNDPQIVNTVETVPTTLTSGTSLKTSDEILTVTPRSDGLLIQIDYTKTEASKTWIHNTICVRDITDSSNTYPIEIEDFSINENEDGEAVNTEILYPYTKRGRNYKVYIIHMNRNWGEWDLTENDAIQVSAIGGSGILYANAKDAFYVSTSDTHKILLKNFVIKNPGLDISQSWLKGVFRIDTRDYYDGNIDTNQGLVLDGNVVNINANNVIDYIKDKNQIYVELKYRLHYLYQGQNLTFSQVIYENKDKWFSDMSGSQPAIKLPVIKINSTNSNGTLGFVSEPVAHHVKDAQRGWNDLSNVNTPDPWYEVCTVTAIDENGTTTSVNDSPAQVKVRGNWTTNYDKKSLRIKFTNKANILGLNNGKTFRNWVLLAGWKDASLLRDAVGFKMFKALFPEYYTSDCKLVEVYINDVYWGVYLLAEQQETKKNRINITEPENDSDASTDIGYLIEFDKYYTSEDSGEVFTIDYRGPIKDYDGTSLVEPQSGYTIKSDVNAPAQRNFIAGYMNKLWKLCYDAVYNKKYYKFDTDFNLEVYTPEGATDDEKCKNCISEVIDIKSLADMYIFNELVCDPDLYLTSFFMDVDFASGKDHKIRFEAPWDFDSTMGNKRHIANSQGMFAGKTQPDVNYENSGCANPWMVIFIKQGWFQSLVKSEWAARNPDAAKTTVCNFIDNSVTNFGTRLEFNRTRWGDPRANGELSPSSKTAAETSQAASATYLKNWLTDRFTAVGSIINGLTTE